MFFNTYMKASISIPSKYDYILIHRNKKKPLLYRNGSLY